MNDILINEIGNINLRDIQIYQVKIQHRVIYNLLL